MKDGPTHTQKVFRTRKGYLVKVDEGIFDILAYLHALGVDTLYSCQGDRYPAYVLADARSFNRLVRRILRNYLRGRYSPETRATVRNFLRGRRELNFDVYTGQGHVQWFGHSIHFGSNRRRQRYEYEYIIDNHWGFRLAIRWPKKHNERIFDLLVETLEMR
jgi:hypothetical protein